MPRATTKTELLTAANTGWDKLWKTIETIPCGAKAIVFDFADDTKLKEAHWKRDKNMRDVLIHLYEWQRLLIDWISANLRGEKKPFLPEPYTWKTYGDMNVELWKKHQSTPYNKAADMLRESHEKVMGLIEDLSNDELFEKKHFTWTGTSNVGSYCISATISHYDWAMKKIKAFIKSEVKG